MKIYPHNRVRLPKRSLRPQKRHQAHFGYLPAERADNKMMLRRILMAFGLIGVISLFRAGCETEKPMVNKTPKSGDISKKVNK